MTKHLILRLDAPLMSFGGDAIDAYGVVRDFPAKSMIAGLIGNALGYERHETDRLDTLQARLAMGAARVREGERIRDFQTAKLEANDKGWTTWGQPEGRAGGAATYLGPHIRYRDADADAVVLVALRLDPADEAPRLDDVVMALDQPERPLFLGRKPFLPSCPINLGFVDTPNVRDALAAACALVAALPLYEQRVQAPCRAQWPKGEGEGGRIVTLTDERNWRTGVHAGLREVVEDCVG